jgi:hypothetical protein
MMVLPILRRGSCEPFKACVHGAALGLAAVMGAYNAAAWLHRRERHLLINAIVYGCAIAFEQRHVAHHVNSCRDLAATRAREQQRPDTVVSIDTARAA